MSLYRRGKTLHYDFSVGGERYRGCTGETVLSRARKIECIRFAEARDQRCSILPRKAPLLSDFATKFLQWVETSEIEPRSKAYYRNGWRQIQPTPLSGMRLDRITNDEVQALRLSGSASNINRARRTLRRMLGKAEEWGVIRRSPRIKLAKEYGRSALIDSETEAKLLAAARQPLRDVLLIMLDTGMRPSEVFRLRWENVNWETRTIFIPNGKTRNSRRFVPMSIRVCDALLVRCAGRREGWVFPSRSKAGHLTTVAKPFSNARERAGLSRSLVLYAARHTFATHVLGATGNLAVVMRALGHSNAQTAMIYQHPSLETVRTAIDQRNETGSLRHNSRHSVIM